MRPWRELWRTEAGTTVFCRDTEDGNYEVFSTQPNDPFLAENRQLQNRGDGFSKSRDLRREGSVPLLLIERWKQEEGVNVLHPSGHAFLKRKLNDYDWSYLRTSPGKT